MSTQTSLNASEVRAMLDSGAEHSTVIKQLIETGAWSESGAAEIVSFMTHGPDRLMKTTASPRRTKQPTIEEG